MKRPVATQKQEGQSLVELALMLVFILVLLAGVVDLGRAMFEYLAMRDAAQEGAGYGAIFPNFCDEIISRVSQNLPDNTYTTTVTVDNKPCKDATAANFCADKEIVIEIEHPFTISMPFASEFTGPGTPIMHVEIKDRIVRPVCD